MAHFAKLFFVLGLAYVHAQYIPIGVGVTNNQPSCKYEFTVPDPKGACSATSSTLDKKIDEVKQDLDKTRLQYVSQNGIVQGTLNQLQTDTKLYVSKVNDLNVELQKIKQNLNSGQPSGTATSGSNTNNQNINKLIHDTKDLLTKAVGDIDGRIFNLTLEFQKNALEESKVNAAIQSQVNNQAVQLATAEQKLLNLENMMKNYKPQAPAVQQPTSGPSNAQLSTLQQKFQQLEQDLKTVDSLQQTEFRGLKDKTNRIMSQLMNQTHDIDAVALLANQSVTQLAAAEQTIQDTKQDLANFKQATDPQLQIVSQEASDLLSKLDGLKANLKQLSGSIIQGKIGTIQNKAAITKAEKQATDLEKELTKIQNEITAQSGEMLSLKTDLAGLKAPVNIGSGGTINTQQLINTIKNQTQADIHQAQTDVLQVKTMVTTLLSQVSRLASRVSKVCTTTPSG